MAEDGCTVEAEAGCRGWLLEYRMRSSVEAEAGCRG